MFSNNLQGEMKLKINKFLKIEKKYDLYHLEIDGVQPWMYVRFNFWNYQVCKELLALSENTSGKEKSQGHIQKLKDMLLHLADRNARRVCQADIVFCAHQRRIKTDGYYECIYTDCLLDRYPKNIVWESPFQGRHLIPVKAKHVFHTDLADMKWYAKVKCQRKTGKYRRIYEQVKVKFAEPLKEISTAYHFTISSNQIYSELAETVLEVQARKKVYGKILDRLSPRLIVEVVYYEKSLLVLNELAKARGIPVAELQHGTMHAAHAAYQFADGCGKISQFPDYEFVFSDYWKKCAHLPIEDTHIKITGYPYFERQLLKYDNCAIKEEKIINIIFVSQWTISRELSQFAADLCDLLDAGKYHIIYKLHPSEYDGWREQHSELLKDNIEVIDNREHNIYEFFSQCSIQVGVYSTAIYEGLGFHLTTYIYDIGHADTMEELCRQGYATYVKSAEELYMHITTEKTNGNRKDGKNFWKMDSLENICAEIDKLLENES